MYRVEERKVRMVTIIGICVALLLISVAFSLLSDSLKISGSGKMNVYSFDVHFENVDATVVGRAEYVLPEVTTTTVFNNFYVIFNSPGDSVTYQVDVINNGSSDVYLADIVQNEAKCESDDITDSLMVCENYQSILTYDDGVLVMKGDILKTGERKRLKYTLSYPRDVNLFPKSSTALDNLGLLLIYSQK